MAFKKTKKVTKEVAEAVEETAPRSGCDHCSNTGLEPGVALDSARVCPVCQGSPFGV